MSFAILHQRLSMVVSNGINNTNLNYLKPHKIIINNTTFLAFNYIPDETNNSVIYMKEPIPIEIGVKPVNMETMKNDTSNQR